MNQGNLFSVVYIVGIFALMYFFLIRPQQKQAKKKKELIEGIKVKDKIITVGGIYGTVTKVKDDSFRVEIADKIEIEVMKNALLGKQDK